MKIALLGYGKMGREIEKIAIERNHEIILRIDIDNQYEFTGDKLGSADVAIDFSTPASAFSNILKCFSAATPVVSGTTGWLDKIGEVREECMKMGGTFFYASNFSLGVNIFFAVNQFLASLMNRFGDYDVGIKEIHHIHKLDAPSGTAISLANDIIERYEKKKKWKLNSENEMSALNITSVRENEVPGTHIITWDSGIDKIEIIHEAKNRKGLALGAVLAAEFVKDKKGIFSMKDMLNL